MHNMSQQDARGDQCDACGKLINATELKVLCMICYNSLTCDPRICTSAFILNKVK